MTVIHAGLVQHRCTPDRDENIHRSVAGVRAAAARGANLVVLQELHATPYFCQTEDPACFDLAEPVPGPGTETFGALAAVGVAYLANNDKVAEDVLAKFKERTGK